MRISKTAWFILGIGIFVIALGSLIFGYSRLSGEQEIAEEKLSAAQALLPPLVSEKADLESQLAQFENQLAQTESSLDRSKAQFPESVPSIEYDEVLFGIAEDCGLEVFTLTASEPEELAVEVEPAELEIEDIIYNTTTFEVEVRAAGPPPAPLTEAYINQSIDNILAFINTVVTGEYFTAATIDLVNIEAPDTWEEGEKPSATITLVIYSYQGE